MDKATKNALIVHLALTYIAGNAVKILAFLIDRMDGDNRACASHNEIAEATGLSGGTVGRLLNAYLVVQIKAVVIHYEAGGACTYCICPKFLQTALDAIKPEQNHPPQNVTTPQNDPDTPPQNVTTCTENNQSNGEAQDPDLQLYVRAEYNNKNIYISNKTHSGNHSQNKLNTREESREGVFGQHSKSGQESEIKTVGEFLPAVVDHAATPPGGTISTPEWMLTGALKSSSQRFVERFATVYPPEGLRAFEQFWDAFPKKTHRDEAEAEFFQRRYYGEIDAMLEDIAERRAAQPHFQPDDFYCTNPARYLRDQQWRMDEYGNKAVPVLRDLSEKTRHAEMQRAMEEAAYPWENYEFV